MTTLRRRMQVLPATVAIAMALGGCSGAEGRGAQSELRVCADPNNLPFSNARGEGFENRIAELIARDMNARVKYTWWAQRRGFIRNTLNASACDLVIGVPASFDLTAVTKPYYRSSYVFVTRRDHGLHITSFDDPVLRKLRIGVQLVGDDGANTPPVHAFDKRGITGNLHGYLVYGDYRQPNPASRIVDAVARGEVDVAVVWGPLAGYFARRQPVPLEIVPVSPQIDLPFMPLVFDIALGVRRQDRTFRDTLDGILDREHDSIVAILTEYGVPLVGASASPPVT
ncbi:MAG TPA: substrate-binding domain-containing protein [Gemmatimonadaceae bacterium]|nr:substrate-binding domain-containing protein [Gemmatimonadaceae bacterium]